MQHEVSGFLEFESEEWQLAAGLKCQPCDLRIRKSEADSFRETGLEEHLRAQEIESLTIGGCSSEFCVDFTIRRALSLRFTVQLLSDAHTTHDKAHFSAEKIREHHNITLSMSFLVITMTANEW